ncbi:MAG: Dihydrolipoamide dehydrogenase of 2-oxoglutarate dehydrogenase, partial [uncultured Craurococcus sp.]
ARQLRPHRHRFRPRRLCLRHPRRPARAEDGLRGEAGHARRHLPQYRLHPLQGPAPEQRELRGSGPQAGRPRGGDRGGEARPRQDAGAEGRGGQRQRQGRRIPLPQEQGHLAEGRREDHRPRPGRGQWRDLPGQGHRHRDRQRQHPAARRRGRREARRHLDRRAGAGQGPGPSRRHRRWRHRPRARLGLEAARRAGDGDRVSRSPHPRHGCRARQAGRALLRQAGDEVPPEVEGGGGRAGCGGRDAEGRARRRRRCGGDPRRCRAACHRPPPLCRGARPRRGRRQARRARPHRHRRAFRDQCPRHLRHRRLHRRRHAGPQGGGGGRRRRRDPRRAGRPRELQRHPERGLHLARDRLGRRDRGRAEGRGRRLQGRQIPLHRQWPRAGDERYGRLREDPGRCQDRQGARRPYHRPGCRDADRRDGDGHGVRRQRRGCRPHLPRPSDVERGGEGSGAGRRRAGVAYL